MTLNTAFEPMHERPRSLAKAGERGDLGLTYSRRQVKWPGHRQWWSAPDMRAAAQIR